MPLQLFKLDERLEPSGPTFQRIVDEAKQRITRYCPEWTDHNVSDPGVALIELFAWMTETLLYRVNQVPDRMLVRFLELIGMRLEPPRAASAPVTFYLVTPLAGSDQSAVTIDTGTEVATVRTETVEALTFTTRADLALRAPVIQAGRAYVQSHGGAGAAWREYDLRQLEAGRPILIFGEPPALEDAFYLPLEHDHSQHVLALVTACEKARPGRLLPDDPPRVWEVSTGQGTWAACGIERDETKGFSRAAGDIVLRLPEMAPAEYQGRRAYWLRCRYHTRTDDNSYGRSPALEALRLETRGGTAVACHEAVVTDELLGQSDGSPGQQFALRRTPVLTRHPEQEYLLVRRPDGIEERWQEVEHFGASHSDCHYTLDSVSGTVTLAPWLLQPDGQFFRLGQVPPKGSQILFRRYRTGGGWVDVAAGALIVLKTSNPFVRRVTNWVAAADGRDGQSLEDAILRSVPTYLRTRERAVTAGDYEHLACQVEGVARAGCLTPGAQPGAGHEPLPGTVVLSVLPDPSEEGKAGPTDSSALTLSKELRRAVEAYLAERRLLGTTLIVQQPAYVRVTVTARLRVSSTGRPPVPAEVRAQAEAALYRYLNPYTGGPQRTGWPFGRDLHRRELVTLLERQIDELELVEELRIEGERLGSAGPATPAAQVGALRLPPDGLIISGEHRIVVEDAQQGEPALR